VTARRRKPSHITHSETVSEPADVAAHADPAALKVRCRKPRNSAAVLADPAKANMSSTTILTSACSSTD
jgi:hypothetical protein